MKKMTCKELGGACDEVFQAETFEQMQELVKAHGAAMFGAQDAAHMGAIQEMMSLMTNPQAMQQWMDDKKALFDAAPEV